MADECPIRQSRVFCTRWNGKTKASGTIDALDSSEISGGLVTLLEETMAFIRRNMRTIWYNLLKECNRLSIQIELSLLLLSRIL